MNMAFTFEQHKEIGARLKCIHGELESLSYEILQAYPPLPDQPKNQPIEISDIDKVGVAAVAKVRGLQCRLENCMFDENPSRSPEELEGIYLAGKSVGRIPISREPTFSDKAKDFGESSVKSSPKMNIGENSNLRKNSNLMKSMTDSYTISKFVEHLSENGYPSLKVNRWPDKENSATTDIDAIAGEFAMEHTSIDTLPNQRKSNDWFSRSIGNLNSELVNHLSFNLMVRFEYEAFTRKQKWEAIFTALKRFVLEDTPRLNWGHTKLNNVPGVPFTLYVDKSNQSPFRLTFARLSPQGLRPELLWCQNRKQPPVRSNFRSQLDSKIQKLVRYKAHEKTTVLLIENPYFLKDHSTLLHWITEVYPQGFSADVDQIWYAGRYNSDFKFLELTSDVQREA